MNSLTHIPRYLVAAVVAVGLLGTGDRAAGQDPSAPLSVLAVDSPIGVSRGLSPDEIRAGWIALFDGATLFGWRNEGDADFRVEEGAIRADRGSAPCLLRTETQFDDYELTVDFRATRTTNSGLFLRTAPRPNDPTGDCFEINIATAEVSPFTTGSAVGRQKTDMAVDAEQWHRLHARATGGMIEVSVDGVPTVRLVDSLPVGRGHIGLQYNQGTIEFRNVFLRPLDLETIPIEIGEGAWRIGPDSDALHVGPAESVDTADGESPAGVRLSGGVGYIESSRTFGDFVLRIEARTGDAGTNSGLFFRCIPGSDLDGYESQIEHRLVDGDRSKPVDFGTGGIFRRAAARQVVSDDRTWFVKTIVVEGNRIAVWVDGHQVVDWADDRKPDPNPRRGARREAGSLALQLHDADTSVEFRHLMARELEARRR
ncbi:MAG TPA: DUF1080 domain-containing protein [Pirellulaceae bacterium]|nr:DUF1080 domain-containing protein [Pirellulaceae bacterium]